MINKVFAQDFVRKMEQTMGLTVNVMDERGIIVASASRERIGDLHLTAHKIIQKDLPMLITYGLGREPFADNAPGIHLRLVSHDETIGVISLSGDPDKLEQTSKIAKLTFETMYEHEYKKGLAVKGRNGIWNFSHVLLNEIPLNHYSILKLAAKLGYQDQYPRLPIYIHLHAEYRSTVIWHFIDHARSLSCHHQQDIILPVDKGILYLMDFKEQASSRADLIKEAAAQAVQVLEQEFLSHERTSGQPLSYGFFIAPVQMSFLSYQSIYQDLLWLAQKKDSLAGTIHHLTDWLPQLIAAQASRELMDPLFSWYSRHIAEHMDIGFFLETVRWLLAADMHIELAAQYLHLPTASVIERIKKIAEILEIDPLSSLHDAVLLQCLYAYMTEQ